MRGVPVQLARFYSMVLKAMAGRPGGDPSILPKYGVKGAAACKIGSNTASKVRRAYGIAKRDSPEDCASPAGIYRVHQGRGTGWCTPAHVQLQYCAKTIRFRVSLLHPPSVSQRPIANNRHSTTIAFCGTDAFSCRRDGGA